MWKPTKKQHITNKKYVDENGGSGSGLVIEATMNADGDMTYSSPIKADLTIEDLFNAVVSITLEDVSGVSSPHKGLSRVIEAGYAPTEGGDDGITVLYYAQKSMFTLIYDKTTGEISQ